MKTWEPKKTIQEDKGLRTGETKDAAKSKAKDLEAFWVSGVRCPQATKVAIDSAVTPEEGSLLVLDGFPSFYLDTPPQFLAYQDHFHYKPFLAVVT